VDVLSAKSVEDCPENNVSLQDSELVATQILCEQHPVASVKMPASTALISQSRGKSSSSQASLISFTAAFACKRKKYHEAIITLKVPSHQIRSA
jgi:hypothetical protein